MLRIFLEQGADVNAVDNMEDTPLHIAVAPDTEVLAITNKRGANKHVQTLRDKKEVVGCLTQEEEKRGRGEERTQIYYTHLYANRHFFPLRKLLLRSVRN